MGPKGLVVVLALLIGLTGCATTYTRMDHKIISRCHDLYLLSYPLPPICVRYNPSLHTEEDKQGINGALYFLTREIRKERGLL